MTIQVKYLLKESIEENAELLLAEFIHDRNASLELPIPIEDIIEKHLKLRIELDNLHQVLDVPQERLEPDIFGALWVDRREIWVDQSLDPEERPSIEGRYRFTLAHEVGHWCLHRTYLARDPNQTPLFTENSQPAIVCRSSQAKERVEWQADFYASSLLMPLAMIRDAWRDQFGEIVPYTLPQSSHMKIRGGDDGVTDATRKTLRRFQDDHKLENFVRPLAKRFQVSATAMRIRLEELGLLHRGAPRQKLLFVHT
ncbi:MAG: ImmA/IrrE family metallo-endopeptidase [Truepera sp.]|nr:ImmA/IrrE family metallo-endopeptidase [Truepera sp.]